MNVNMTSKLLALVFSVLAWVAAPAAHSADDAGPRSGKYLIMSYGAPGAPPIHLGYFVLERGKYKAYLPGDKSNGGGNWHYDPSQHKVVWDSGPYAGVWDGKFEIDRRGKTHKIRMKSTTIGSNSAD